MSPVNRLFFSPLLYKSRQPSLIRINPFLPDLCAVEAKNLRFFASTAHKSGKKGFILKKFGLTHNSILSSIPEPKLVLLSLYILSLLKDRRVACGQAIQKL
jgi:hypothetical protein